MASWFKLSGFDSDMINSVESVDPAVALLTDAVDAADQACIPRVRRQFDSLRLTPEVLALIGERNAASRRWQRSRDHAYRDRIRLLNMAIGRRIDHLVNERFGQSVQRLNDDPDPHCHTCDPYGGRPTGDFLREV